MLVMNIVLAVFVLKWKPFETCAERASVVIDEGVLAVFSALALVFLYVDMSVSLKRSLGNQGSSNNLLGYVLIGLVVLSVMKNLAFVVF